MMNKEIVALKEMPKILVVDDRETERNILAKLLAKFKVEIHTAESGQEGLSRLLRHEYVLVLLDIQMPIMDGLEMARLMRSNHRTENIPIIFLTAYDKDEINMLQGYKVGAIDYLFKPVNEEILLSKVQTFLRGYSFEKEKKYEQILSELETKNKKLKKAQEEAVAMMKEATEAKNLAETSQKQVEKQAQDLLRSNKELEQFAYVATHDLRAPIINLNGLFRIFKRRGFVTQRNKLIVDKIDSSLVRINNTLQDLIQVVAYKKTVEQEVKKINFEEITADIIKDLEAQMRGVGLKITQDFAQAPAIYYIPNHLRSIIQNLLTNAIKYRHEKRKPKISISTKLEGDFVSLKVIDNGIGIDESKKEKVFGLFQRLTTDVEGKGMGLYIIKSQIESKGGSIDFSSVVGKGTEFCVLLESQPIQ